MISVKNAGGGENLTALINEQPPIVADIIESLVGKATGANATAETILEGYSAYVGQELVKGIAKSGLTPEMFGCTKYAVDTITFSSRTLANADISHSLGEKPTIAFFICTNDEPVAYDINFAMIVACGAYPYYTAYRMYNSSLLTSLSTYNGPSITDATVRFLDGSYGGVSYFAAGVTYTLITMA